MAQSRYRWDIERLNDIRLTLQREKEELEQNRQFFANMESEVQSNWESLAGERYRENLEIDLKNYDAIVQGLEQHLARLDRTANQYYQECESYLRGEMNRLGTRIQAI